MRSSAPDELTGDATGHMLPHRARARSFLGAEPLPQLKRSLDMPSDCS